MPIMGIQQGMQPILGYNYGAGQSQRVFKTLKYALIIAVIYSAIFAALLQIFPTNFISIFISSESATLIVAEKKGLKKITILMLPLLSVAFFGVAFYQSIGEGRIALGLSLLRQFIIFVPALYILPVFYGLNGVWAAQPLADGISIVVVGLAILKGYKKLMKHKVSKSNIELTKSV